MKAKTICFTNNKGGVGKSTSCGAFAGILAELGKKVLLVDCDPQGNISHLFQRYRITPKSIIDVFMMKSKDVCSESIQDCIYQTELDNIDIIASNEDFAFTCDDITKDDTRIRQFILKKVLETIKDQYDFILIDSSPFFNIISVNVLSASDYLITPVEADGFSYVGLIQLLKKVYSIKDELNDNLKILGIFLNKLKVTTNVSRDLYKTYKDELKNEFIPVYIRQDNQASESNTTFIPLIKYNQKSNAIKDFKKLIADLHILDEECQKILVQEVKEYYKQEIKLLEKKGSIGDVITFQLEVLKNNLSRL